MAAFGKSLQILAYFILFFLSCTTYWCGFKVLENDWKFRILRMGDHDVIHLKDMQEVYQLIRNRMNKKDYRYLKTIELTLKTYLPYKLPLYIPKKVGSMEIPKELIIKYNKTITLNKERFSLPLLVAPNPRGRLGHRMAVYASFYALGKLYNSSVLIDPNFKRILGESFPFLSMKYMPSGFTKNCIKIPFIFVDNRVGNYSLPQLAAAGLLGPKCFIVTGCPIFMKLFTSLREDMLKEFQFSKKIKSEVRAFFNSIKQTKKLKLNREDCTFVGIHFRLTDYMKHLKVVFGGVFPNENNVVKAVKYFKTKYKNPIFIAASDNITHLKKILKNEKDVFYPNRSPGVDMAVLSSCNHSFFTIGTFGFWASYLAGGEVLYTDVKTRNPYFQTSYFYRDANLYNFIPVNDIL